MGAFGCLYVPFFSEVLGKGELAQLLKWRTKLLREPGSPGTASATGRGEPPRSQAREEGARGRGLFVRLFTEKLFEKAQKKANEDTSTLAQPPRVSLPV